MNTLTSLSFAMLFAAVLLGGRAVVAAESPTKVFEMDCATSPDYYGKIRYDACGPELQEEIDAVLRDFMCPDDETNSAEAAYHYLDDAEKAVREEYIQKKKALKKKIRNLNEEKRVLLKAIENGEQEVAIWQETLDSMDTKVLDAIEDDDLKKKLKEEMKDEEKKLKEDIKEKEEEIKKDYERIKDIDKEREDLEKELAELKQANRMLTAGGFKYEAWCDHMCWGWMPNSCSMAYPWCYGYRRSLEKSDSVPSFSKSKTVVRVGGGSSSEGRALRSRDLAEKELTCELKVKELLKMLKDIKKRIDTDNSECKKMMDWKHLECSCKFGN